MNKFFKIVYALCMICIIIAGFILLFKQPDLEPIDYKEDEDDIIDDDIYDEW